MSLYLLHVIKLLRTYFLVHCQSCDQTFSSVIDQVEIEISATCKTLDKGVTKYLAIEDIESYDCQM